MLISVSKLLSDLDISEKLICQHLKDFLSWHLILDQVKLCWKKWYLITRIRYHIITHPITFHNIKHIITDGWLKLIIVNWCVCIVCNARYIKLKLTYETVDHDGKMLQLQLLVLILSLSWILQSCSSPQDDLQVSESLQYLYFKFVPLPQVVVDLPPAGRHPAGGHQWRQRPHPGHWRRWSQVSWELSGEDRHCSMYHSYHCTMIQIPGTTSMILTMTMTGFSIYTMMMTMETVLSTLGCILHF